METILDPEDDLPKAYMCSNCWAYGNLSTDIETVEVEGEAEITKLVATCPICEEQLDINTV